MSDQPDQQYWFKRRRYGYGWIPTTWQGWLTIVVFIVTVIGSGLALGITSDNDPDSPKVATYLAIVFISIVILALISNIKGPKPKWRWGKQPEDNPEEDF